MQASSTDLDVAISTLGDILSFLGYCLLLLVAAAASVGAGMLTGKVCTYLRGKNWTKDERNPPLWGILAFVNGIGFALIGLMVLYTQLSYAHYGKPSLSYAGTLGLTVLIELMLTLIVGAGLMVYIAIERTLRRHTEENDRLHETPDDNGYQGDDEERAVDGKDWW